MRSKNKDGNEYRIGSKSLHDLYPSKIREKVANDEKCKFWDPHHKTATAEALRQLHNFESNLPGNARLRGLAETILVNLTLLLSDAQNMNLKEKLCKEDLEGYLDLLNNVEKKYSECKIPYDCVLFRSDDCWYAVIDTTEMVGSSNPA